MSTSKLIKDSRIQAAAAALDVHPSDGSTEENVIDLLTDLIHYCRANKVRWDNVVDMAESHFIHETETMFA